MIRTGRAGSVVVGGGGTVVGAAVVAAVEGVVPTEEGPEPAEATTVVLGRVISAAVVAGAGADVGSCGGGQHLEVVVGRARDRRDDERRDTDERNRGRRQHLGLATTGPSTLADRLLEHAERHLGEGERGQQRPPCGPALVLEHQVQRPVVQVHAVGAQPQPHQR